MSEVSRSTMMVPLASAARASMLLFLCCRRGWLHRKSLARLYSAENNLESNLISSTKSNTVKKIQALLHKRKKRLEYGKTVVEGTRIVLDLLADTKTRHLVKQVLISTDKWDSYYHELLETLQDEEHLPSILPATPPVLAACSDTVTPQGIVAIVDIPNLTIQERRFPLYLVIDRVQDPGNLGTILRSCAATGVSAVYLLPDSCDPWNPKAVRSGMGTSFQVPIRQPSSWQDCLEDLESLACRRIWAATMLDDVVGTSHYHVDWVGEPTALVIGSEGNGLSSAIRKTLTSNSMIRPVHVPMEVGVESLNAAVCGSVIMFEYLRQRQLKEISEQNES